MNEWDNWYRGLEEPAPYGDPLTYELGAEFLEGLFVEDWGCGKGWMRTLIPPERYRGIDGSITPFADEIVDLTSYRSEVAAVFMRHVLEHNLAWKLILDNALASAQERFCLIVFTPIAFSATYVINHEAMVPDISFRLEDLTDPIREAGFDYTTTTHSTVTQYGSETVFRCARLEPALVRR